MITPNRRTLITGLAALIASPAIVRASSLMPVKHLERMGMRPRRLQSFRVYVSDAYGREIRGGFRPFRIAVDGEPLSQTLMAVPEGGDLYRLDIPDEITNGGREMILYAEDRRTFCSLDLARIRCP